MGPCIYQYTINTSKYFFLSIFVLPSLLAFTWFRCFRFSYIRYFGFFMIYLLVFKRLYFNSGWRQYFRPSAFEFPICFWISRFWYWSCLKQTQFRYWYIGSESDPYLLPFSSTIGACIPDVDVTGKLMLSGKWWLWFYKWWYCWTWMKSKILDARKMFAMST